MNALRTEYITRWILQINQNDEVMLERKLVPKENPINYLITEDGDYTYSTLTLHNQNFTIVYKEEESEKLKSIIYVGKIDFIEDKQVVLDLTQDDEAHIETLADIFLREDKTFMH